MARFGLQIPNFTIDGPDTEIFDHVLGQALVAEEVGCESVWVMDHLFQLPALGGPDQPMLEAYTLLGALAARTEKVKLGTLVTGVTYRNPALLAKIVTTLDVISKGRAVLGLGAAWYDVEHDGLGYRFPPVGERMDRLDEALQVCKAMFTQDRATFEGEHYTLRDAPNVPRPVQVGGPEILVGGGGEKRTLRLVARHADYCNVTGDADVLRHKVKVLHDHCADVGRDPAEVTVSRMSSLFVTGSAEETESTRQFLRSAAGDDADRMFDVGQPDEVLTRLSELVEAGVDYFIFNLPMAPTDKVRTDLANVIDALG